MQAHPILEAIGTVGSSALSGGVGAELTGGDFWRGAATGAIVGAFNHLGDKVENSIDDHINDKTLKRLKKLYDNAGFVLDVKDAYNGDKYAQFKVSVSLAGKAGLIPIPLLSKLNIVLTTVEAYIFYMDYLQPIVDKSLQSEGANPQQRSYYHKQQILNDYNKHINNTQIFLPDGKGGYKTVK